MSPSERETFDIASPLDLQLAVLRSQRSVLLHGASDLERSVVATIVSELGSNVLKYARHGTVELTRLRRGPLSDIEIVARDQGPGIADVELALQDHYSSGRTLGLGLPAVRRMADELDIGATEGGGTTVRVRKRLVGPSVAAGAGRALAPLAHEGPHWSAAAAIRPRPGSLQGGDLAAVVARDERLLLAIVDVTGHGAAAAELARSLVDGVRERFLASGEPDDVAALLLGLHEACVGTVGAAAGIAVLDAGRATLRYLAVGNVRSAVVGAGAPAPKRFTGVSRDGLLGRRWPTPFVQQTRLEPGDLVLLWTDGLPEALARTLARRRESSTPFDEDVGTVAHGLLAGSAKDHDDAACLVARFRP
jgi:anti-sigma regulatory factor (Ser/Thr protein kinase)